MVEPCLYRAVLGPAFAHLPPAVQALHGTSAARQWAGSAEVRRGRGWLARLVAAAFGFPRAAATVPLTVSFTPEGAGERWVRTFGEHSFSSLQLLGCGQQAHLLLERFGPAVFALELTVEGGKLFLQARHGSIFGVPLPRWLLPTGRSFETERDGVFCFDVQVVLPGVGFVAGYRGRLVPAPGQLR